MSHSMRILPAADADVDGAANYICKDNLEAALRFYDAVDATYAEIRLYPTRWAIYDLPCLQLSNVRKRSVVGFDAYLIFYRLDHRVVEVIRVLQGARDIPAVLFRS